MRVSARADYALRATVCLAAQFNEILNAERIATLQDIPLNFLQKILYELGQVDIVVSRRGIDGGYRLARPAMHISVAEVIRAVDGPLATVHGLRPQDLNYPDNTAVLTTLWVAMRASVRGVLENVSLADLAEGKLPPRIRQTTLSMDA